MSAAFCFFVCAILLGSWRLGYGEVTSPGHKKEKIGDEEHFKDGVHNPEYDRQAFLGEEEAKKYKELTPEQSKERLAKLLVRMDKDNDGFLNEQELKDHIAYMNKRYISKDVERNWAHYKKVITPDGRLSWDNFKTSFYGPEDPADLGKDYQRLLNRDKRRWKKVDLDGDDHINLTEYSCFIHPETCEHMKELVVKETMEDMDKNGDGFVDLEEYINDLYRPQDYPDQKTEPDWVASERTMFKQYRDKNGDGKMDAEEMRNWLMPPGFDNVEAEANHLLHLSDDNKDGKLSKEEVLTHYEVFVGSQATDYGEQLHTHDPSEL